MKYKTNEGRDQTLIVSGDFAINHMEEYIRIHGHLVDSTHYLFNNVAVVLSRDDHRLRLRTTGKIPRHVGMVAEELFNVEPKNTVHELEWCSYN